MGAHLLHSLPCKACGKPFRARPYDYLTGRKIYCSRECYTASRPRGHRRSFKTDYQRKLESIARHPEKHRCRTRFEYARKRGYIKKRRCWKCGAVKVEAHHWDYTKPLEVFWLCRPHHVAAHNGTLALPLPCKPVLPAGPWGQEGRLKVPLRKAA